MKKRENLGIAIILLFLISLRFANLFFIWFAILVVLLLYGSKMWIKHVQNKLNGQIKFHANRIFPGEEVSGELILENRSSFPVFGVMLEFDFWTNAPIESEYLTSFDKDKKSNLTGYRGRFNLGKKQKVTIPIKITSHTRGVYSIREMVISAGDPLGIETFEKRITFFEELLVYPTEIDLQGLNQTHRIPQGESVVSRWILDDIFFPVGARPYQYGDAYNRIDFKATAKLQKLHTKKFDFTAHGDICVIANLLTSSYKWIFDEEHFERTLSIGARLARESLQKDLRFSLFCNAQAGKGNRVFEIPSSSGRQHYRKVLEVLARFSFFHATPLSLTIAKVKQRFPNGALAVVITSYLDEKMMQELNLLTRQGFEVYVVDSVQEIPQIERWSIYSWKERAIQHG